MALCIDGCLITLILGLLGLILFAPTGGRIRVEGALFSSQDCSPQSLKVLQELNVPVPPDLNLDVTEVASCTRSVLGHVHDRVLIVTETTRAYIATKTREMTYSLDTIGRPTRAFYLDSLGGLLFAAYVFLLEWRTGRTLGKDLMDIRVRSLSGGPPNLVQTAKRFIIRFLNIILLEILSLIPITGVTVSMETRFVWFGVSLLWFLAVLLNFIVAVRRNALPWHDRFAGTEVVLGR
jgi:uncharacterized RDD family membrane protein YckC